MSSLEQFDDHIVSHSLLTHYFYAQKWNKGELSKEDLAIYAKEYFHLAKNVPTIVECVRVRAMEQRPDMLPAIEENLQEETEHIDLWKRFAKSLGVSEAELEAYQPTAQTQEAVCRLQERAERSFEDGVAVMYAMELDIPAIAQSKKDGLTEFYGLTSEDAHVYFDEHLNEEEHFAVWRQVNIDEAQAKDSIDESLAAQHLVLDGVCEACGIEKMEC